MKTLSDKFRWGILGFSAWLIGSLSLLGVGIPPWLQVLGINREMPADFLSLPTLLHGLLSLAFMGVFLITLADRDKAILWAGISVFMSILLPGGGIVLTMAAFLFVPGVDMETMEDDEKELEEKFFTMQKKTRLSKAINDLGKTGLANQFRVEQMMMSWIDLISIDDLLMGDDLMKKRSAITALSNQPSAIAVKKLKKMLGDDNGDIRFCASSALLKIEEKITEDAADLRDKILESEPAPQDRLDLATCYLKAVELGILPDVTSQQRLRDTLELLKPLPESPERSLLEIKVNQFQGNFDKVITEIERTETNDTDMLFALCDAYLREGRYSELSKVSETLTTRFWNSGNKRLYDIGQWSANQGKVNGNR